jgi:hypothetical protein
MVAKGRNEMDKIEKINNLFPLGESTDPEDPGKDFDDQELTEDEEWEDIDDEDFEDYLYEDDDEYDDDDD